MPFTHEPRAPESPESHPEQRYFCGTQDGERWVGDVARVYRFAGDTTAHVDLRTAFGKSRGEVTAYLSAAELRELAHRLLDAAHDLDTFPATAGAAV